VVISLWAASNKLKIRFITCGGLLLGPDKLKYFSAVLTDKKVAVSPKLAKLHQLAHDKNARDKACVRSNWTASFLAPNEAIRFSDKELKNYGSSNKKVLQVSSKITLAQIQKMKIDPKALIPYSTWYEAKQTGKREELLKLIKFGTL